MPQFLILKQQYNKLLVSLGAPYQAVEQSCLDVLHCNVTEREGRCPHAPLCPSSPSCKSPSAGFPNVSCTQPVPSASPQIPHYACLCFEVSQSPITLWQRLHCTSMSFLSFFFISSSGWALPLST